MSGERLIIKGVNGRRVIDGEIIVNGSKNDAVQAIAASLLFKNNFTIANLPLLTDIAKMLTLLELLSIKITRQPKQTTINFPFRLAKVALDAGVACQIRASVLLTGPLLARWGQVSFPHPGG